MEKKENIKPQENHKVNSTDLLYYGFADKLIDAPFMRIEKFLSFTFLCFSTICILLGMILILFVLVCGG